MLMPRLKGFAHILEAFCGRRGELHSFGNERVLCMKVTIFDPSYTILDTMLRNNQCHVVCMCVDM